VWVGWALWYTEHKVKLIEEIEKVQKRATRMLPRLARLPYAERLQKLHLLSLVQRRVRGDTIEVFKIIYGCCDTECVRHLQPSTYLNTRGRNIQLYKLHSCLELRKPYFSVRVVSKWNSTHCWCSKCFKNHHDKFWSTHKVYYNYKVDFVQFGDEPATETK